MLPDNNNGLVPVSAWIEDIWKYDFFSESNSNPSPVQATLPSVVSKESDDSASSDFS